MEHITVPGWIVFRMIPGLVTRSMILVSVMTLADIATLTIPAPAIAMIQDRPMTPVTAATIPPAPEWECKPVSENA